MGKKVVVGMSGGVDSSVAAMLLKEEGYEVIGVTMQLWQESELTGAEASVSCGSLSAVEDAQKVAEKLDIPHFVMDFRSEFHQSVIDYFINEYERAYTPNPCNVCNRRIKWEALLQRAGEIGADFIATGHYARIDRLPNGRYSIRNSVTAEKDQTYALYDLTQDQLAHTLMPVGQYEKSRIRQLAEEAGLPVAHKHDSQDICFIPDHDYAAFIERETGRQPLPGNFVDEEGRILGRHRGLIHYTIGQRKGLGLTAETPLFVKELRPETNEVVICRSESLFTNTCIAEGVNYMAEPSLSGPIESFGKVRYSHKGAECLLEPLPDGKIKATFKEPQRAMTPGQAAVFYQGDHILCGGRIIRA